MVAMKKVLRNAVAALAEALTSLALVGSCGGATADDGNTHRPCDVSRACGELSNRDAGSMTMSDAADGGRASSLDFAPDPGPGLGLGIVVPQRPDGYTWGTVPTDSCTGPGEGSCKAALWDALETCTPGWCGEYVVHIENGCFTELTQSLGRPPLPCLLDKLRASTPCALTGFARAYVSCTLQ